MRIFLLLSITHALNIQSNQLVINNYKLVPYYIHKKYNTYPKYIKEELTQVGYVGLIKASESFDSKYNNTFGTYAYYYIYGYTMNYLRKIKKFRNEYVTDYDKQVYLLKDTKSFDYEKKNYNIWIVKSFFNGLDSDEKKMLFYEYFFLRKTQKELSQKYNMNRNTIRRIFKNEIEIFKNKYSNMFTL
jgi:RNA polymerase sigma factor (sigma-70 family)